MELGKDRAWLEEDCLLWTPAGGLQRDRLKRVRAYHAYFCHLCLDLDHLFPTKNCNEITLLQEESNHITHYYTIILFLTDSNSNVDMQHFHHYVA